MKNRLIHSLATLCLSGALLAGSAPTAYAAEPDYSSEIEAMTDWLNGLTVTQQAPSGNSGSGNSAAAAPATLTADELAAYADKVFELVNAEREQAGLAPLERDGLLDEAAAIRAAEIVDSYTHTRPDGEYYSTVIDELGIKRGASGEIIYTSPTTPESAVKGWMSSDGHRDHILKEKYTTTGIGIHQDENGGLHWVQLFIQEK